MRANLIQIIYHLDSVRELEILNLYCKRKRPNEELIVKQKENIY